MYLLPYCDLIQSIYYIYHDKRLGYQWWHRPSQVATTVYEREIGFGGIFGHKWFQGYWQSHQQLAQPGISIAWQDLYAIVVAVDRRNFGCDTASARPPACPYRLWGRGRGVPRQPDGGEECRLFLARNRMTTVAFEKRVFLKLSLFSKRFSSTEVKFRTWEKISNIYKWKEKVQNNTYLSFWWKAKSSSYEICLRGRHLCCRFCCELGRHNTWLRSISFQTMVFAAVRTHFPRKNTSLFMSIGILSREKK